ncbi:MAG TPA: tetratricopeptide repeat protein [Thermoanaerobaculia bacterium]|nr:tetratricopeptide repeat protein [Thermoanaerobaculia bacterium]
MAWARADPTPGLHLSPIRSNHARDFALRGGTEVPTLNWATGRDGEAARVLKDTYKGVLETLVALIENGDGRELPTVVRHLRGGRTLTWRISGARCAYCETCGCDRARYEPEGEGLAFEFCPACWSMRGSDRERQGSFAVGKVVEKRLHDLLPGTRMELTVRGGRLPLGPADSPGGPGEALDAYRTAARRPLEIGRQFELGRLSFAGTSETPPDYAEARLWLERAARWGHGEALSMLGLMALHGLGEAREPRKAVELCREAAARGCPKAEAGMGRLCWDGVYVSEDRAAAVEWWRRAARRKDPEAQLWLGRALILGEGVERDESAGLALVREAAEAGDADAQAWLGSFLDGRAG